MKEMLCDIKRSTESVGLGIHPDKILSNQEKVKEREVTIDHIKIEVLQKNDSARYFGQKITFEEHETAEVKNRLKATLGITQISTGTHLERLPSVSQTTLVQHGDHANDDIRKWDVDVVANS